MFFQMFAQWTTKQTDLSASHGQGSVYGTEPNDCKFNGNTSVFQGFQLTDSEKMKAVGDPGVKKTTFSVF